MAKAKNVLFIMFDQLRWDYLSCYGHPHLKTPHLDRLAAMGVRFNRCYVQSPVCGASRMSTYTGRYVHSHGAAWNNFPLKVGEETLGDHLRRAEVECWLIGKTHMAADAEGMRRLGLAPDSVIGARVAECGFDAYVREDGLRPEGPTGFYDAKRSPYNEYLKSRGYEGENPWHDYANSGVDADGQIASGWLMKNAPMAAHVHESDSETPWLTDCAIKFMEEKADGPWVCHLSYIKPHWPYIVPAPYHDMYGPKDIIPPVREVSERDNPHPVYGAFMDNQIGRTFSRDEVREAVIPVYMGLIKQIDDQMGRLFDWMEKTGRMADTMIVATSDHGDYLGDHWLGEKDLFHDASVKVPLIIYDPSPEADATRGTVSDALVEQIDLAATFVDHYAASVPDHVMEGRSLLPLLRGEVPSEWRDYAISEYDYSVTEMAETLGVRVKDARLFMVADRKWKFMHAEGGFRPMLFDLEADPNECRDLGDDPAYAEVITLMYERLNAWARRPSQRTTMSDAAIMARRGGTTAKGVLIGIHEGDEIDPKFHAAYHGPAPRLPDRE